MSRYMSAEWKVIGQVGTVRKNGDYWLVNVADNQYWNGKKEFEVWFHLISSFKPCVKTGDKVIACGVFRPSSNKNFQYAMIIDHIGVIGKDEEGQIPDSGVEDYDSVTGTNLQFTHCAPQSG